MAQEHEIQEKQRAVFTILALAVLVDGDFRPLESVELDALMRRSRTLHGLPEHLRDKLRVETVRHVRKSLESGETATDRILEACNSLKKLQAADAKNKDLCRSVFLHALDLVHMDDHLTPKDRRGPRGLDQQEETFIDILEQELQPAGAHDHALMRLKNSL